MNRTALRLLPIPALAAAVAAGGALLATRPWEGDEASAGTIKYRLCDTVVEGPLAQPGGEYTVLVGTKLIPAEFRLDGEREATFDIRLLERGGGRSEVSIDAETASVLRESYAKPLHETKLGEVLRTVRREPFDPETAGWPYTDTSQLSSEPKRSGAFEYREPDPASGIQVSLIRGLGGDGSLSHTLRVENCRSSMEISWAYRADATTETTVTRNVDAADEAAFDTFFRQMTVQGIE